MRKNIVLACVVITTVVLQLQCGAGPQKAEPPTAVAPGAADAGHSQVDDGGVDAGGGQTVGAESLTSDIEAEYNPETDTETGGFEPVADARVSHERHPGLQQRPPTLNVLKTMLKSPSASVRADAVLDLVAISDYQAIAVLENLMLRDPSLNVRLTATQALVLRGARGSVNAMRRAVQTASTSAERAAISKAIEMLLGLRERN